MNDQLSPLPSFKPGRYRHYKGNEYILAGVVRHSETLEPMVLYQPLYEGSSLWVRPAGMWNEDVLVNGETVARFTWVAAE
jgi:hypothetical protein